MEQRKLEREIKRIAHLYPDISYCLNCGEYLGDYVNGVLYKFGRVVTEPHICMNGASHEQPQDRTHCA